MVRRCGKQKQVHIQTKNPATMINNCINESLVTSFHQYRETRRKCRPQALVKPKMWSVLQEGHLSSRKTSAQPQPASPAAPGAQQGCSWRPACADDSHRVVLWTLQELGGAGPPPGILEMGTVWGPRRCIYIYIYYRLHLHSKFAGIHPKDLTVLPYCHIVTTMKLTVLCMGVLFSIWHGFN